VLWPAVLVDHWFASFRTVSRCLAACTRPEKVRVCHPCGCRYGCSGRVARGPRWLVTGNCTTGRRLSARGF